MAGGCCIPDEDLTSEARVEAHYGFIEGVAHQSTFSALPSLLTTLCGDDEEGSIKERGGGHRVSSYSWRDPPESIISTAAGGEKLNAGLVYQGMERPASLNDPSGGEQRRHDLAYVKV